ncbi:C-C motif chemokine 4-like [Macrotis lagotis]|uniref:C-C motif chemokine 4-like n=1 Tax=Macrotis lagotis TaxID=92651 RepID=UPI003D68F0A6
MKVSLAAFSILMVMAFSSVASSAPKDSDIATSCCFSYVSHRIPRKLVIDYYKTRSMCSQPAVVFLTKRGHWVCANPSKKWVQNYVNYLELRGSALWTQSKRKMIQN